MIGKGSVPEVGAHGNLSATGEQKKMTVKHLQGVTFARVHAVKDATTSSEKLLTRDFRIQG